MRRDIKRTAIFNEMDSDKQIEFFHMKEKKYFHNIDNIYFTVFIQDDSNENEKVNFMYGELLGLKLKVLETYEEIHFINDLFVTYLSAKGGYDVCLSNRNRYDIFFARKLPNQDTPRIMVQIRSTPLWTENTKELLAEIYSELTFVLENYDLQIRDIRENRFDYAYHTNYIQNPDKFLSEDNIEKTLVTDYRFYQKAGEIKNKSELVKQYFALGDRSSNNTFTRIYDKTKEVVDKSHKVYFFEIWKNVGLISKYDQYCLEYAYKSSSYEKRYEGMLYFYLEYGKNNVVKDLMQKLLHDPSRTAEEVRKMALYYCPPVTTITNIEFETKRKYYYIYGTIIDALECSIQESHPLARIFKIIENRKMFLNNLSMRTVTFVNPDTGDFTDWWKRLIKTKIDCKSWDYYLKKDYQKNLDQSRVLVRTINSIGSNAVYNRKAYSGFVEDISDFISNINDNHKIQVDLKVLNDDGQLLADFAEDISSQKFLDQYQVRKEKKFLRMKKDLNKRSQKRLEELIKEEMDRGVQQLDLDTLLKKLFSEGINFL